MSLSKSAGCLLDRLDGLMSFVTNPSQYSKYGAVDRSNTAKGPEFSYAQITRSSDPVDIIRTGESATFHFVTSDSVTLSSTSSSLGELLLPFDSSL